MDLVSIVVATNRTIAKLKDDGIEALTLIGADGKQYEVTVDKSGNLAVTVKPTDTPDTPDGSDFDGVVIPFDANADLTDVPRYDYSGFEEYTYFVSDFVPTREQMEACYVEVIYADGQTKTLRFANVDDFTGGSFKHYHLDVENNSAMVDVQVFIPNDRGYPAGVYVNLKNNGFIQNHEYGNPMVSGKIFFPNV